MNPSPNAAVSPLPGELMFVILVAAILALPIAALLLKVYRGRVLQSMRSQARGRAQGSPAVSATSAAPRPPGAVELQIDSQSVADMQPQAVHLLDETLRRPWQAGLIYTLAGIVFAAVMTASTFLSAQPRIEFGAIGFIAFTWVYAWPVVLTLNLVAGSTRRTKLLTLTTYVGGLLVVSVVALLRSPKLTLAQIGLAWLLTNLVPTLLLVAFLNRRVRAVGPLVLTFLALTLAGSTIGLAVVGSDQSILNSVGKAGFALGLNAVGVFAGIIVVAALVFAIPGWLVLRGLGSLYERKRISDQSITLDAMWLLFALVGVIPLITSGVQAWLLAAPTAFVAYRVVAFAGFRLTRSRSEGHPVRPQKLLLLRVFALGKRSERLFDAIGTHWRYVGSIQLIAGPDLATTTIEPHEFLDFLRGRLARRFIDGPAVLDARMAELDLRPDDDGRFRVNDFFCYEDTWRMVLGRLVAETDVALIDLRGFTSGQAGCVFEIKALVDTVPLERILLVVDGTTDDRYLRDVVRQAWEEIRAESPNRAAAAPRLRLFRLDSLRGGTLRQLLALSSTAATSLGARPQSAITVPAAVGQ